MKKTITFTAYLDIFKKKRYVMLKNKFYNICQNFTKNSKLIHKLWSEINRAYSQENRHYHRLSHLENIYNELAPFNLKPHTEFAIFYHDIVYDVQKKNNEKNSAYFAIKHINSLFTPSNLNEKTYQLIIETEKHQTNSTENYLFLDADIAILGKEEEVYIEYLKNIRQEYYIYSDEEYNKGRKIILKKFLEKDKIYLSNYFHKLYEEKARENIKYEIELLK